MTFTPIVNGVVSSNNSTSSTLTSGQTFTGTSDDVSRYGSVKIGITTNVNSDNTGITLEFSSDGTNWDIVKYETYDAAVQYYEIESPVRGKFFRVVYINGATNQSTFRLQTIYHITNNTVQTVNLSESITDAFGRVRVSNPRTILSNNQVLGKNHSYVYEAISGSATSTHDSDASCVDIATTGTGSVIRRSRRRGIYQPGKSLLIYMTGILDDGSNVSTVTTKIGYYDDDSGFYFQYNDGTVSVVKRTSVTGSTIETVVNQTDWNVDRMDTSYTLDVSKTLIYWIDMEWLGVGVVNMGVIINGALQPLHKFRHSNTGSQVYIRTASLPPTCEIISTGGAGSLKCICYTVISEGGFKPSGNVFSANMGTTTKPISSTAEPLIAIRLSSNSIATAIATRSSVISTSGANTLVQIYKFQDTAATSILTGSSFVSASSESEVEYDVSATAINLTGGMLLDTIYFSNNEDNARFGRSDIFISNNNNNVSDLLVIVITSLGPSENYIGSMTWEELI